MMAAAGGRATGAAGGRVRQPLAGVAARQPPHSLPLGSPGAGAANVFEIDVAGGPPTQLTFETNRVYSISVSTDNRVAYVPFWHDTFLFSVDVASGERRQLNANSKDNFGARFAPDGRSVVYHSTRTGNSEIWVCYLDGRPETQITDNDSWDLYPDWSPDGERMIFGLRPRGVALQDLHRELRRRRGAAAGGSADHPGQSIFAGHRQPGQPLVARRRTDRVSRGGRESPGPLDGRGER